MRKIDLEFTTGAEIYHAWKEDAHIAANWLLESDFMPFESQEFVWQYYFNIPAKSVIGQHWFRRHLRQKGSKRTLCYLPCHSAAREWMKEPDKNGVADECPMCRTLAEYYHRKQNS